MKIYHVLNLGAGVQSTCLYLMSMLPEYGLRYDAVVMADTQEESDATYAHLRWLQSLGGTEIWVRSLGKLGDEITYESKVNRKRHVTVPAFTGPDTLNRFHGWREGIMRRQCAKEYKVEVVVRTIREELLGMRRGQRVPKDVMVCQHFGISTDERGRTKRTLPEPWAHPTYPLIDLEMSRADCVRWLVGRVPHAVPRSACVFCPYHSNREWADMKAGDAKSWARAVEIDRALRVPGNAVNRGMDQEMFLHRRCIPLEMVDLDDGPTLFDGLQEECEGVCGT